MKNRFKTIVSSCALLLGICTPLIAQELDKFSFKSPVSVSGKLNTTTTFYSTTGRSQRDPFYWLISGSVNISYNGISIPLSFNFSQQQRTFAQPFNQLGMSPEYKWLKLHLGYRSLSFSDLTLAGNTFLGGGVEVSPKNSNLRYSAMYGQLIKPIQPGNIQDSFRKMPAYARNGYGTKITHEKDGNIVDFIFFRGADDESSVDIPDSLNISPEENALIGVNIKRRIAKKLSINIQTAFSGYTQDRRLPETVNNDFSFRNNLNPFLETNASTQFNKAIISDFSYKGKTYNIKLAYKRIDPEFRTMGSTFLVNDIENVNATVSWVMLKNKVNISTSYGRQRDNLNSDKVSEAERDIGAFNVVYILNPQLSLTANYSNFGASTTYDPTLFLDSLNYLLVTRNASLGGNYIFKGGKTNRTAYVFASYQGVDDPAGNSSTFYNVTSGYQILYPSSGLILNTGMTYTNNAVTGLINDSYGPTVSVARSFFDKKLKGQIGTTFLQSYMDGGLQSRFVNFRLNGSYTLKSNHKINLISTLLNKATFGENEENTIEFRGQFGYSYSF
ncbi:hypothetical protein FNH22_01025 [Fulvivirga sp. M361]|uniref:hypothetical protein n=1 Tax=Fulvivirga sp. M361 TaxID=2594266 RepID=UPI00117AD21D|nr:hypothetical protein [Fulvivirga sp. M361]TRX62709.1 hypothetical protein FNH22_01025 [Fulvivirga sp. M361]